MIPVCEPTLEGNESKYVNEAMKTGWISSGGKYITQFEEKFSKFVNAKHGIACSNGTVALHLALLALGIKNGDEVIVPDFTMIASINAILYVGAKPVFVDAKRDTWNMDVIKIKNLITKRTKAIMVVHIYGHPTNMDEVLKLSKKYGLFVVEDAAEAHGAKYKGKKVGCLGDIGCFSFYANKIITTGEGGMVVTNNENLAKKCRLLRNLAFTKPRFSHNELGYNYRLTNLQAAIGVGQMEYVEKLVERRIRNAKLYNKLLSNVEGLTLPIEKDWAKNVYWMYGVLVEESFGLTMEELREELFKRGVDTRTFFLPMHKQPCVLKRYPEYRRKKYPVSIELSKRGFYLPSSSNLTQKQIRTVCNTIKDIKKEINQKKKLNKKKDSISIILPTYNEMENIVKLIKECLKHTPNLKEIIVVDDDSPDKTWQIAQNLKHQKVKVIRRTKEKGLPSAISRGIDEAKGDILMWMDCDLCHPPFLIPKMLKKLNDKDLVVASRYAKGGKDLRSFSRIATSRLLNTFISLLFFSPMRDWTSGYVAVRSSVFEKVNFTKKGYGEYFIDLMYKSIKAGFKISSIGYVFTDRQVGESKTVNNIFSMPMHGLRYTTKALKLVLKK
jgi:perosamine synthetase